MPFRASMGFEPWGRTRTALHVDRPVMPPLRGFVVIGMVFSTIMPPLAGLDRFGNPNTVGHRSPVRGDMIVAPGSTQRDQPRKGGMEQAPSLREVLIFVSVAAENVQLPVRGINSALRKNLSSSQTTVLLRVAPGGSPCHCSRRLASFFKRTETESAPINNNPVNKPATSRGWRA